MHVPLTASSCAHTNSFSRTLWNPLLALTSRILAALTTIYWLASCTLGNWHEDLKKVTFKAALKGVWFCLYSLWTPQQATTDSVSCKKNTFCEAFRVLCEQGLLDWAILLEKTSQSQKRNKTNGSYFCLRPKPRNCPLLNIVSIVLICCVCHAIDQSANRNEKPVHFYWRSGVVEAVLQLQGIYCRNRQTFPCLFSSSLLHQFSSECGHYFLWETNVFLSHLDFERYKPGLSQFLPYRSAIVRTEDDSFWTKTCGLLTWQSKLECLVALCRALLRP